MYGKFYVWNHDEHANSKDVKEFVYSPFFYNQDDAGKFYDLMLVEEIRTYKKLPESIYFRNRSDHDRLSKAFIDFKLD